MLHVHGDGARRFAMFDANHALLSLHKAALQEQVGKAVSREIY